VVTLCPCHVSLSLLRTFAQNRSLQEALSILLNWRSEFFVSPSPVSPLSALNFLSKHETLARVLSYQEGRLYAQPPATVDAWIIFSYYLSIFAWAHGCSVGTCIVSSPWIQRSPTFCPWPGVEAERGAETKKKPCTVRSSTIERYWLHSASRNRPPLFWTSPVLRVKFTLGQGWPNCCAAVI
jgi:hypothetical protein